MHFCWKIYTADAKVLTFFIKWPQSIKTKISHSVQATDTRHLVPPLINTVKATGISQNSCMKFGMVISKYQSLIHGVFDRHTDKTYVNLITFPCDLW
jgi:hypothetical protein